MHFFFFLIVGAIKSPIFMQFIDDIFHGTESNRKMHTIQEETYHNYTH